MARWTEKANQDSEEIQREEELNKARQDNYNDAVFKSKGAQEELATIEKNLEELMKNNEKMYNF